MSVVLAMMRWARWLVIMDMGAAGEHAGGCVDSDGVGVCVACRAVGIGAVCEVWASTCGVGAGADVDAATNQGRCAVAAAAAVWGIATSGVCTAAFAVVGIGDVPRRWLWGWW